MESEKRSDNAQDDELPNDEGKSADDANLLYSRGMAHYRRRQWREARDCFVRLKAIQSERRGIDALLDELNIFIQLEAIQPERKEPAPGRPVGKVEEREESGVEFLAPHPTRRRTWPGLLVALIFLAVVAFAVLYAQGMLPGLGNTQREDRLRNLGQAYLVAGNYRGAINVFQELLAIVPGDREAQVGLAKAYYEEAVRCMSDRQWDSALQYFKAILEVDANYRDVDEQIAFVERRSQLEFLYSDALSFYEQQTWASAIERFGQLKALDDTYRAQEVQRYLFDSYYGYGLALVDTSGANLDQVTQAIARFDEAAELNPSDGRPAAERELAETYLEGCDLFDQGYWERSIAALSVLYVARPDYAGGRASQLLCQAHLNMAATREDAGELEAALQGYRAILSLGVCEGDEAAVRITAIAAALTPTVTPTSTAIPATPTYTPLPTATRTSTLASTNTPLPTHTPTPTPQPTAKPPKPPKTPEPTGRPPKPSSG